MQSGWSARFNRCARKQAIATVTGYLQGGRATRLSARAVVSRRAVQQNRETLGGAQSGEAAQVEGDVDEVQISGDLAMLRGSWTATITPSDGSEPFADTGSFVEVYRWQHPRGAWLGDPDAAVRFLEQAAAEKDPAFRSDPDA